MSVVLRCDICLKEIEHSERHLWMVGEPGKDLSQCTFTFDLCNDCFVEVKRNFSSYIDSIKKRRETGQHDGSSLMRSDTWHY